MKKLILAVSFSLLFWSGDGFAQTLPESAVLNLNVINISNENKDAQTVGAKAGDVVRYELNLKSETEDIIDFVTTADLTSVLQSSEIIDTGLGEITDTALTYPKFIKAAPCDENFIFFARVKEDCGGADKIAFTWEGLPVNIALDCTLTPTGPSNYGTIIFTILAGIILFFSLFYSRKAHRSAP